MRRKPDAILPNELAILQAAAQLHAAGTPCFHGYLLARHMRDASGARKLVGHGTLYKAFDRLQNRGLLDSEWEDPGLAAAEGRPRRRLYRLTTAGAAALAGNPATTPAQKLRFEPEGT